MNYGGETSPDEKKTTLWIIWGALIGALFIYLFVVLYLAEVGEVPDDTDAEMIETMTYLFPALAVGSAGAAFVLRRVLFFRRYDNGEFASSQELSEGYFTTKIISWSLAEAVAIYGFALSLLTYEVHYYAMYMAPALALMIFFRPKLSERLEKYEANGAEPDAGGDEMW